MLGEELRIWRVWLALASLSFLHFTDSYANNVGIISWKGHKVEVNKDRFLVKLNTNNIGSSVWAQLQNEYGFNEIRYIKSIDVYIMKVGSKKKLENVLTELTNNKHIKYCEPDYIVRLSYTCPPVNPIPNDPGYQSSPAFYCGSMTPIYSGKWQYYLQQIEADRAWNDSRVIGSKGDTNESAAVLDTGVDYLHEDLDSKVVGGFNYITPYTSFMDDNYVAGPLLLEIDGHGTHCAGIILAESNNNQGITGISWNPYLQGLKILDNYGFGSMTDMIAAIDQVVIWGSTVASISAGCGGGSIPPDLQNMVDYALNHGVTIVAATGDLPTFPEIAYPAAIPGVIAVGAVDPNDAWASYSTYSVPAGGQGVTVVAPGTGILSTALDPQGQPGWNNNYYSDRTVGSPLANLNGTSFSCPIVSGVVLNMLSQNQDWAPETVRRRLIETSEKVLPPSGVYDADGFNEYMGYGRVNMYYALGGLDQKGIYSSNIYISDTKTVISAPFDTNRTQRHWFMDSSAGTVVFSMIGDNTLGKADVPLSGTVNVLNPDGSITPCVLNQNVQPDGTILFITGAQTVPLNTSFIEKQYVPEASIIDAKAITTKCPMPAYKVPGAVPASLETTALTNPIVSGGSTNINVIAKDKWGNILFDVPITGNVGNAPDPLPGNAGASLAMVTTPTQGGIPDAQSVVTVSTASGPNLFIYHVDYPGLEQVEVSITITGISGAATAVNLFTQYETIAPSGSSKINAYVYDQYENIILAPDPNSMTFTVIVGNGTITGPVTLGLNGALNVTFNGPATEEFGGTPDTVQGSYSGLNGTVNVSIRNPQTIEVTSLPSRVPVGDPAYINTIVRSSDGLAIGGVRTRISLLSGPFGGNAEISDDFGMMRGNSVDLISQSPAYVTAIVQTGVKIGTVTAQVSIPDYPTIGAVGVSVQLTRDWPQFCRGSNRNSYSPDEILTCPLRIDWIRENNATNWSLSSPVVEGGKVFGSVVSSYRTKSIQVLDAELGTFLTDAQYDYDNYECYSSTVRFCNDKQDIYLKGGGSGGYYGYRRYDFVNPNSLVLDAFQSPYAFGFSAPAVYNNNVISWEHIGNYTNTIAQFYTIRNASDLLVKKVNLITDEPTGGAFMISDLFSIYNRRAFGLKMKYCWPGVFRYADNMEMQAYDTETGELLWSRNILPDLPQYTVYAYSPQIIIARVGSKDIVFAAIKYGDIRLIALDATDGSIIWNRTLTHLDPNDYTPYYFLVEAYDRIYLLEYSVDSPHTKNYQFVEAFDAATGNPISKSIFNPPILSKLYEGMAYGSIANGLIYLPLFMQDSTSIVILDAYSGEFRQELVIPNKVGVGNTYDGVAIANTHAYIQAGDSSIVCLGPGVNCPTNVSIKLAGSNVSLSWVLAKDATYPIDGYRIIRDENNSGILKDIAILGKTETIYLDTTVVGGNKYTYIVDAFDTKGTYSENCSQVSIDTTLCTGGLAISGPTVDMSATPCSGDVVFIEMKVTNNWCHPLTNVIPSIVDITGNQLIPGSIIPKLGCDTISIPSLGVGETATVLWGGILKKKGNLVTQWKVSASGTDSLGGVLIKGEATGGKTDVKVGGSSMDVGAPQLTTPKYSCVGEPFRIEVTVTNTGCQLIEKIVSTLTVQPSNILISSLVCAPVWTSLHPGGACTFVFSGTGIKTGTALGIWTVDVTGSEQITHNVITGSNFSNLGILDFRNPVFTVSAPYFATPTNTCIGMPVNVVVNVVNARCHAINNISATVMDLLKYEPGRMIGNFTLVKPALSSIPANSTAAYTWAGTIKTVSSGGVKWAGSVGGYEDQTGKLVWADNIAGIVVISSMSPTFYVESLVFDWSGNHCVGDPVSVIMKVTNHRCRDVVDLVPSLQDMKSNEPGGIIDLQLVTPAPTTVQAGGSVSFTWAGTITKSGSETVKWRGSVTGKEDQTGILQSGRYELPLQTIGAGAVLDASLSWQRGLKYNVPFDVVLTVKNTNTNGALPGVDVNFAGIGVIKEIRADGSDLPHNSVLEWLTTPLAPVPFPLSPGESKSFTWKVNGLQPGLAFLNAVVRGISCDTTPVEFSTDLDANIVSIHYDSGDWPVWGHDAQHTFNQPLSTGMNPPLELKWSVPDGVCPVVYQDYSYWCESQNANGMQRTVLTARRVIDGAVAWRRAITSPFIACGGGMVFAEGYTWPPGQSPLSIYCYDAITGSLITTIGGIQYPLSALTVDSGTLFIATIGGAQNQWPYTTTNGKVMAYHIGDKSLSPLYTTDTGYILASTPPLVVGGKVYVAHYGLIALDAITGILLWTKPFPPGFMLFPDARYSYSPSGLSWDGNNIIMVGRMWGRNTNWSIALSPTSGNIVWGRNYDGTELFDPATGLGRIGLFRRQPNAGNIFTSAVISPGNGDILLDSYPMLWVNSYPALGLMGKSMISNGFVYHNARNTAFKGVDARYQYPTTYDVFDYPGVAQKKPVWTPSTWGAGTPAIAHGMMFADGGYVYGPRTIDPPILSVTKGRYEATLDWTDANTVKDISPDHIVKYELFRSIKEGLIWANGFENPANAPFITKIGDFQPWAGSYTDKGLDACPDYFYAIRAVTQNGRKSWYSKEVALKVGGICVTVFEVFTLNKYPCNVTSSAPTKPSTGLGVQMVYGALGDIDYPVEYRLYAPGLANTNPSNWQTYPPSHFGYGPNFLGSATGNVYKCSCYTYVNQVRDPHCTESVPGNACIEARVYIPSTHSYEYRTACGSGSAITSCCYNVVQPGLPKYMPCYDCEVTSKGVVVFCDHLHPESMSADAQDFVYVVDTLKNRVQRFDAKGKWLSDLGSDKGKTLGKPSSCAVAKDGTVYVVDSINNRVAVFTEDGEWTGQFGRHGNGNGEFDQPNGIALDATGGIWVSDSNNGRLELFDSSGTIMKTIGKKGDGPGEFKSPSQVTIDSDGNLWVADTGNDRVQKVSPSGMALAAIGSGTGAMDSLMQPEGIAIDNTKKYIYVSNTINNSVEMFTENGSHLYRIGGKGTELGMFMHPQGLALDTTNKYLYVADTLNNRGQRFTMGTPPSDSIIPRAELFRMENMVEPVGTRIEIRGRAVDAYFKHYVISIMDSLGTTMLIDSDKPVWKGILGVWDTLEYSPGKYIVRLIVEDDSGNVSEDSMTVFLFNAFESIAGYLHQNIGPNDGMIGFRNDIFTRLKASKASNLLGHSGFDE